MNISKTFREIADDIRSAFVKHSTAAPRRFECTTRHGTRISCISSNEAISSVIAKYEKAAKRCPVPIKKAGIKKIAFSFTDALNRFITDGEIENAIAFADACGKPIIFCSAKKEPWPIKSAQILTDERFAVGISIDQWSVTHIDSGKSLGCGNNKKEALAAHEFLKSKFSSERIDAELHKNACDFQNAAREFFTSQYNKVA